MRRIKRYILGDGPGGDSGTQEQTKVGGSEAEAQRKSAILPGRKRLFTHDEAVHI